MGLKFFSSFYISHNIYLNICFKSGYALLITNLATRRFFFCVSKESTNNLFAAKVQIYSCQKGHCDKKKSFIGKILNVLLVWDLNNVKQRFKYVF